MASPGRKAAALVLPSVLKEYKPDLVLANVENLSGGRGITEDTLNEVRQLGIDYFTGL